MHQPNPLLFLVCSFKFKSCFRSRAFFDNIQTAKNNKSSKQLHSIDGLSDSYSSKNNGEQRNNIHIDHYFCRANFSNSYIPHHQSVNRHEQNRVCQRAPAAYICWPYKCLIGEKTVDSKRNSSD